MYIRSGSNPSNFLHRVTVRLMFHIFTELDIIYQIVKLHAGINSLLLCVIVSRTHLWDFFLRFFGKVLIRKGTKEYFNFQQIRTYMMEVLYLITKCGYNPGLHAATFGEYRVSFYINSDTHRCIHCGCWGKIVKSQTSFLLKMAFPGLSLELVMW